VIWRSGHLAIWSPLSLAGDVRRPAPVVCALLVVLIASRGGRLSAQGALASQGSPHPNSTVPSEVLENIVAIFGPKQVGASAKIPELDTGRNVWVRRVLEGNGRIGIGEPFHYL